MTVNFVLSTLRLHLQRLLHYAPVSSLQVQSPISPSLNWLFAHDLQSFVLTSCVQGDMSIQTLTWPYSPLFSLRRLPDAWNGHKSQMIYRWIWWESVLKHAQPLSLTNVLTFMRLLTLRKLQFKCILFSRHTLNTAQNKISVLSPDTGNTIHWQIGDLCVLLWFIHLSGI